MGHGGMPTTRPTGPGGQHNSASTTRPAATIVPDAAHTTQPAAYATATRTPMKNRG